MFRKLILTTVLALVLQSLAFTAAFGQDFASLVSSATAANQTYVNQIDTALQATSLATLQAQSATAQATGMTVQADLQAALAIAPDDASRSRVQGVLNHINASLASIKSVSTATTFDLARSDLNAARGEAVEAFSELQPFAPTATPAPTTPTPTLPQTGGFPISFTVLAGLIVIGAGLALRYSAPQDQDTPRERLS